jgi:hypothetical protein
MYIVIASLVTVSLLLWIVFRWHTIQRWPLKRRLMRSGLKRNAMIVDVQTLGWFPHGGSRYRSGAGMQRVARRVYFRVEGDLDEVLTDEIRCELRSVPRQGDRVRARLDPNDPLCAIVVQDSFSGAPIAINDDTR